MSQIQQFLNDETTLLVLRALVLLMALLWLLTGVRFPGKGRKRERRRKDGGPDDRDAGRQ